MAKNESSVSSDFLAMRDLEFRQETIYFIVVDRFHDGDPRNSAGPNPQLYDPQRQDWHKYWGGDLQGVIDKLDYLQHLGITAIWLTPLFEQVEQLAAGRAAVHGYWTRDFKRLNRRFIGEQDDPSLNNPTPTVFDRLLEAVHQRGMKLILDIVCNHSSPEAGGTKGQLFDDGRLIADFANDPNHWYHHYGAVTDWRDEWQLQNCEIGGLATFNENNAEYRKYIKSSIKLWLDRGVDALRIDTVKHMPPWFWQEFVGDMLSHRPSLFITGEWIHSHPSDGRSAPFANQTGMSLLDFGLCLVLRQALGKNDPAGFQIVADILALDSNYDNASELVTFIDNHDMHRFLSLNPDLKALRLALVVLMTSRGIPCLYYGTEQELVNSTGAEDRLPWGNNDPFNRPMMTSWDEGRPLFGVVQKLAKLRRDNPCLAWGCQVVKHVSADVFAYWRAYKGHRCLVAVNRSHARIELNDVMADLPDGRYECVLTGQPRDVRGGKVTLVLEGQGAVVLSRHGEPVTGKTVARIQVNGIATQPGETVMVLGDCPELGEWDVSRAVPLEFINSNCWFGEIVFDVTCGRPLAYKYAIRRAEPGLHEPIRENRHLRRRIVPSRGLTKWRDHCEQMS